MRKWKQIAGLLLAGLLAAGTALSAFAAAEQPVTIRIGRQAATFAAAAEDGTGDAAAVQRTYVGYRLLNLKTTEAADGRTNYDYTVNEKYLAVMQEAVFEDWKNWTGEGKPNAEPSKYNDITPDQILQYLSDQSSDAADGTRGSVHTFGEAVRKKIEAQKIQSDATSVNGTFKNQEQGYWLILDTTDLSGKDEANSLIILETKGQTDITVEPKMSVPTVDKDVLDLDTGDWAEDGSADYNIGDEVTFQLTGTVADYYDAYETYYYAFHDTLKGLKFNQDSLKVTIDGTEIEKGNETYQVRTSPEDGCSFHVIFLDLKKIASVTADSKIVVTYTAKLLADAAIGNPGNPNEVHLEFSNNPYDENDHGNTLPDEVRVFTFELDITKVDKSSQKPDYARPNVPDGYNTKLQGAEFVLYRFEKDDSGKDTKQYVKVDNNGKVIDWTPEITGEDGKDPYPTEAILTSNKDGRIQITGLEAGQYFLKEIKAPDGYNLLKDDISIMIDADYTVNEQGQQEVSDLTINVNGGSDAIQGDPATGIVQLVVENSSGVQLPETGGMGTTLLYIFGGILIVGAGTLLIVKRRREDEKES